MNGARVFGYGLENVFPSWSFGNFLLSLVVYVGGFYGPSPCALGVYHSFLDLFRRLMASLFLFLSTFSRGVKSTHV